MSFPTRRPTKEEMFRIRCLDVDGLHVCCEIDDMQACGQPGDWQNGTCRDGHDLRIGLDLCEVAKVLGSKGGSKAARNMTAEQRSARAKTAAKARWGK